MSDTQNSPPVIAADVLAQLQHGACRFLSFDQLAQGKQEILIEFKGQIYRLRATKNDKLILNK
jgi:Hemin uptake protein